MHFHQIPSKRSPSRGSNFDLHTKARDSVVVVVAGVVVDVDVAGVVVDVDVLVVVVVGFAGAALVVDADVLLVGSGSGKNTAGGLVLV